MNKVDELIGKFKSIKEELNKNVNASYSTSPNSATGEKLTMHKNGQWSLDKSGTNKEANPNGNHNKEKFKVMPLVEEKSITKESVQDEPYSKKEGEQFDDNKGRSMPMGN